MVVSMLAVWALAAVWGHGRLLAEFVRDPPQDHNLALARHLVDHESGTDLPTIGTHTARSAGPMNR